LADFKYSGTTNPHTLYNDLKKGFSQANTVVLKLYKGDLNTLNNAVNEIFRKGDHIGNMVIINRYGKIIEIKYSQIVDGSYLKKLRGFF
jgi:hypothetical protein